MTLPTFQQMMLPLLALAQDGQPHDLAAAVEEIAQHFQLTTQERQELLPSGRHTILYDRVAWVRTYLGKATLVASIKLGTFKITKRGLDLLASGLLGITVADLKKYPEFKAWYEGLPAEGGASQPPLEETTGLTPEELLETSYQKLNNVLAEELLQEVRTCTATRFEQLVVDLLVAMGYGGTLKDAGKAIGKSGDGGIDGIIKQDKLGFEAVYIQAKRWDNAVGAPVVTSFVGALKAANAHKGVLITTAKFTEHAKAIVKQVPQRIVLIDGEQVAQLMIEHDIGVTSTATYTVKRVDSAYLHGET